MTSRPKGLWNTTPLLSACDETKKNGRVPTEWCSSIFEKVIGMILLLHFFQYQSKVMKIQKFSRNSEPLR